jgi:hypothetical protein
MRWTKKRPIVKGYYWVDFEMWDLHHQGPQVLYVDIEDGEISVIETGGDHERSLEDFQKYEEVTICKWSDEPIVLPKDETE